MPEKIGPGWLTVHAQKSPFSILWAEIQIVTTQSLVARQVIEVVRFKIEVGQSPKAGIRGAQYARQDFLSQVPLTGTVGIPILQAAPKFLTIRACAPYLGSTVLIRDYRCQVHGST